MGISDIVCFLAELRLERNLPESRDFITASTAFAIKIQRIFSQNSLTKICRNIGKPDEEVKTPNL